MAGSFFPVLSGALAGWLSGIGRTITVTWVTFVSLGVNAVLAWGLVLGSWGLPMLGIAGAALATVAAQMLAAALYALLFARTGGFSDPAARRFNGAEFRHFLSLAAPLGLRISGELIAWTLFLVMVGRLGTVELAASSIAFRINGVAFFPALGLGQAAGILVGHARGAGRDEEIPAIGWQSLGVCELWMLAMAGLFVATPEALVAIFAGDGPDSAQLVATGALLMKFVAVYCIFDAANIVIGCVLAAAGDTHWLARAFCVASAVFLALLWLSDRIFPSLLVEWTLATVFVCATAMVWALRFHAGGWKKIRLLRQ
jgi:MATE family multidrug resistance protein